MEFYLRLLFSKFESKIGFQIHKVVQIKKINKKTYENYWILNRHRNAFQADSQVESHKAICMEKKDSQVKKIKKKNNL